MHRCLQIPEIISLICTEISGGKPFAITSHTSLAALAQTCKFFQDPALDELWKAQSSLKPLLRCFPADALARDEQGRLLFCRPLERRDWFRVLFYVPRIKVLTYKLNKFYKQSPAPEYDFADISVWQMLAISKPPSLKHLLPNLRSLAWHESQDATSPYITLLLAPTITHFRFWTNTTATGSPLLLSIIPSLPEICPLLEYIQLMGQTTSTGIRVVSEMVSQWNSLRQIDIDALNPCALLHLANMPTLETLRIYHADQLGEVRWTGDGLFPILRQLVLHNPNMTWVTDFMVSTKPPRLQYLGVRPINHYPLSQWKQFFTSLIHLRSSLTTLIVQTGSSEHTEGIFDRDTLEPLLDLSRLVVLKIRPTTGFDIDDEALRELSAAWPWLRELELIDSQVGVQPRITLPGISPLVLNCPRLVYLAITFDASVIDHPPESRSDNCNMKLESLKVGRSPIKDFVNVAAFLLDLAPNLTTVKTSNDHPDMIEKWGHVARLLQTFGKRRVPVAQAL